MEDFEDMALRKRINDILNAQIRQSGGYGTHIGAVKAAKTRRKHMMGDGAFVGGYGNQGRSAWIDQVRQYSHDMGISYKDALIALGRNITKKKAVRRAPIKKRAIKKKAVKKRVVKKKLTKKKAVGRRKGIAKRIGKLAKELGKGAFVGGARVGGARMPAKLLRELYEMY